MDKVIRQFELGPMQNYIYFIGDKKEKKVAVVDPAWDVKTILDKVQKLEYHLEAIFITHKHYDHVNGVLEILQHHDIPVFVSKYEISFPYELKENIKRTSPNETYQVGSIPIQFLHTPGHTPGSQCFLLDKELIAGDTLFIDGCGRCDLDEGDPEVMYHTIYNVLMKLPNNTIIYPGHNYHTKQKDTLENQKKTNPYMQFSDVKEFICFRMSPR